MCYDEAHQGIWSGKFVKLEIIGKLWILFVAVFLEICGNTGEIILQSANTKRDSLQTLTHPPVKLLLVFAATQPEKFSHWPVHCSERRMTSHTSTTSKRWDPCWPDPLLLEQLKQRPMGQHPASVLQTWGNESSPGPGKKHCSTSEGGGQWTHDLAPFLVSQCTNEACCVGRIRLEI